MDLMDLFIKLGVKDEASDKLGKVKESVGNGLKTAAKIGAAAVATAGAAVVGIAKEAIGQYAEYEQLVGGVETLFGNSANKVLEYANNAYSSAGMSANEYMQTVTGFSASLLQGLGGDTEKATEVANRAITDMSDNANKMGTSMESIQNAYQGFAKQNYTMLDNLKLGYGGTKEEMERLISDASKMTDEMNKLGVSVDGSSTSFDNIINAISVVQEHLGITGTTAKEASTTIQGSVASMKSAWQNLLTGLTGGTAEFQQNLGTLIDNFVQSVSTVWDNLQPQIIKALDGIAQLVTTLAPKIAEILPPMIESLLPALITSITALIGAMADTIPTIIETLSNLAPTMITAGLTILTALENGFIDNMDVVIDTAVKIILQLAIGLIDALPKLLEAAPMLIKSLGNAIIENMPLILEAGVKLIGALAQGVLAAISTAIQAVGSVMDVIMGLFNSLGEAGKTWGSDLINNFISGILNMWHSLVSTLQNVAQTVKNFLGFSEPKDGPLSNFHTYAPDMMKLFAKGIADNEDLVKDQIAKSFDFESSIAVNSRKSSENMGKNGPGETYKIVVQSVLDGKVIGETAYKWSKNHNKAMGLA